MNVLLFAGTTEGRKLAEALRRFPVEATICVATDYGVETLGAMPERFTVLAGRMEAESMRALMEKTACDCVVDATHPYAAAVSRNIRMAAAAAGVPSYRLLRRKSAAHDGVYVESADAAAGAVAKTSGPVLLTTGSKDLAAYAGTPDYAERIYVRVLPSVESIQACERSGYKRSHIIAMQGPFGKELNLALMRQYGIRVMVTKDGGETGGFFDKMTAAAEAGVLPVVIGRPVEEDGLEFEDILRTITKGLEAET